MVNSIRGILTFKSTDQLGVETGGVEWALETTATTLSALPPNGAEVKIYTFLHHSQDMMKMYGFLHREERTMFLALLTVNGVGPALARKILSGISSDRLLAALDTEDMATLSSIPGLGGKTAQKIVLHLRGKLTESSDRIAEAEGEVRDVIDSLVAMGFEARGAGKVVTSILSDPSVTKLPRADREKEILRRAIVELSS